MKIADKRKVIEVLLCCAQSPDDHCGWLTTHEVSRMIHGKRVRGHHKAWMSVRRASDRAGHEETHGAIAITAAYRLIESSPTLRREWFGAP